MQFQLMSASQVKQEPTIDIERFSELFRYLTPWGFGEHAVVISKRAFRVSHCHRGHMMYTWCNWLSSRFSIASSPGSPLCASNYCEWWPLYFMGGSKVITRNNCSRAEGRLGIRLTRDYTCTCTYRYKRGKETNNPWNQDTLLIRTRSSVLRVSGLISIAH